MRFSWQDAYGVENACQMQIQNPTFALPENKLPLQDVVGPCLAECCSVMYSNLVKSGFTLKY